MTDIGDGEPRAHVNYAHIIGEAGSRLELPRRRGGPSTFSVKTTRDITAVDGDSLSKFDWHSVVSMLNPKVVNKIRQGMLIDVEGTISTTRTKGAIIAMRIRIPELGVDWKAPNVGESYECST